jgi:hypothetical protein
MTYSGLQMNVQVDNDFAVFFSRIAAPEFSRGFQPTDEYSDVIVSRQRRLNYTRRPGSIVADATGFVPVALTVG